MKKQDIDLFLLSIAILICKFYCPPSNLNHNCPYISFSVLLLSSLTTKVLLTKVLILEVSDVLQVVSWQQIFEQVGSQLLGSTSGALRYRSLLRPGSAVLFAQLASMAMSPSNPMRKYSWWWDSHISPKNSKWLQENLTGIIYFHCGDFIFSLTITAMSSIGKNSYALKTSALGIATSLLQNHCVTE